MREKGSEPEEGGSSSWRKRLKRHIPILGWIVSYKKMDLLADMIAGLTVGLTLIPQSVAYAGLAGLSPEYGLYSSFMGSFIYVVFGTIKEVSVGPNSLISLLTFEFTKEMPIECVFLLTFLCGTVELLLGLLQFGFLVNFISIPVTTSFQSATSLIIISSQLKDLLGVPKFKSGGFLTNIAAIARRIKQTRMGDLALGVFCCTFLLLLRKLKDIKISKNKEPTKKEKIINKILWFISISRNAICVFISCVIAYNFTLYGEPPFKLSGNIPSGLPPLRFPQFSIQNGNETLTFTDIVQHISSGVLVIPLISILANVTIAKAFSTGSQVDATQEMITLGFCNISGSLVSSMPTCGAFTRSAVFNSSGVRTPLAGLFTGTLIILVIKFLTPYFYYIPRATLASVLVCAVMFMFDWKTIFLFWKVNSKYQFLIFLTHSHFLMYRYSCFRVFVVTVFSRGVAGRLGSLKPKKPSEILNTRTAKGVGYTLKEYFYQFYNDNFLELWKLFPGIDFLCSMVTFWSCLLFGIQAGLVLGVAVNAGHLLYIWARPSISVEVMTQVDKSYYKITPDIGFYFPATDFIRNTIANQCVQNIPVVVDCVHFRGIDYTAARAIKELGQHCQKRGQKLIFINMSYDIYILLKNSNVDLNLKQSIDPEDLNEVLFYPEEQESLPAVVMDSDVKEKKNEETIEGKALL